MPVIAARPLTNAPTQAQQTHPPTLAPTNRLTAKFDFPSNGVDGRIEMWQPDPSGPTYVAVSIIGAIGNRRRQASGQRNFGQYHVHEFPRDPTNPDGPCSVTAVGGHWNPYGAAGKCNPQQPGTCEVGDLSGKHGQLTGSFYQVAYIDLFLPLTGPF
jgi:hypothetical protein